MSSLLHKKCELGTYMDKKCKHNLWKLPNELYIAQLFQTLPNLNFYFMKRAQYTVLVKNTLIVTLKNNNLYLPLNYRYNFLWRIFWATRCTRKHGKILSVQPSTKRSKIRLYLQEWANHEKDYDSQKHLRLQHVS